MLPVRFQRQSRGGYGIRGTQEEVNTGLVMRSIGTANWPVSLRVAGAWGLDRCGRLWSDSEEQEGWA